MSVQVSASQSVSKRVSSRVWQECQITSGGEGEVEGECVSVSVNESLRVSVNKTETERASGSAKVYNSTCV